MFKSSVSVDWKSPANVAELTILPFNLISLGS